MSQDEAAGNLMLMGGLLATGMAVPWVGWGLHWIWSAPVAAAGMALACGGLWRLRTSR